MILKKNNKLCEELGLVYVCLPQKNIKFCDQNLRNDKEDENERGWTTFGFDNENEFSDIFC